jgi:hypothetical protein
LLTKRNEYLPTLRGKLYRIEKQIVQHSRKYSRDGLPRILLRAERVRE